MRIRMALASLALAVVVGFGALAGGGNARAAQLLHGWNNVSYLGSSASPSQALAGISGQYSAVYRWDPAQQAYQLYAPGVPGFVNTLTQINPGDAIWVNYSQQSGELNTGTVGSGGNPAGGAGKLSIAASAFVPASDLAIYEKNFNQLNPVGNDVASQRYYAPVTLPQGAAITTMVAAFEGSGDTVKIRLDYTALTNGDTSSAVFKLAEVLSSGGSSPQSATAFAHTVDNGANVYFLVVDLTGGAASKLRGVSISYTY